LRHGPLPLPLSFSLSRQAGRRVNRRTNALVSSSRRPLNLAHLAALRRPAGGRAPPGVHSGPWLFSCDREEREARRREEESFGESRRGKKNVFFCVLFARPSSFLETPRRRSVSLSLSLSLSLSCCTHFHESFFFINRFFNFHQIGDNRKKYKSFLSPCFKPSS